MKILVVEDDPSICDVLEYALMVDGYIVQKTQRGREAVEIARQSSPELILLDVGLPDIDGFEVCRLIRTFSEVPVIFLTSRGDEINRVVGLEIGGDDYVVKPFSTRELMARVKAVRRRYGQPKPFIYRNFFDEDYLLQERPGRPPGPHSARLSLLINSTKAVFGCFPSKSIANTWSMIGVLTAAFRAQSNALRVVGTPSAIPDIPAVISWSDSPRPSLSPRPRLRLWREKQVTVRSPIPLRP